MTERHAKEEFKMMDAHELAWFKHKMKDLPEVEAIKAEDELRQQIAQDKKDLTARHYAELKAHPENPELNPNWDNYFRPKNIMSMEELMAQQKTEEQKFLEEIASAVAKDKDIFKELQEQDDKRKRDRSLDIEP